MELFSRSCFRQVRNMSKIDIQKFHNAKGEFKRQDSSFRSVIGKDPKFPVEPDRYHLYVSYACPWANRTLIARKLKGLEDYLDYSVVHWHMDSKGWRFPSNDDPCEGATPDKLYGYKRLSELYYRANPNYEGRFTVPVLWDKKQHTIVNNESSEIIRIFNTAFNELLEKDGKHEQAKLDLYPESLQAQIDQTNDWIYNNINNGVYKAGFAGKQEVYEEEVKKVFAHLDKVEDELSNDGQEFIVGDQLTEADIRLFVTIIRFDPVYVQHFKCNIGMIRFDYPNIHKWLRRLYWNYPELKDTVHFDHIKFHYTKSHPQINPLGITPVGPLPNILPL
ncbi:Omega class glutathione transferase [Komagataella phaffii GS115]|uniref:Glutathione S-transferase omega-like 2 n=2 Tax=Komagataella phaffii TaxID=460519 RepID=C4R0A6_KOMPG|nr:Omega class glutathione transferase [Komagataella phaffii GS115]AOA62411.1 GQ67_00351T0 [Komagataella phaffii]AOA67195.1 GQ68_01038T0 [Komagataella phaffii GS115]CAY68930.1 Omega class glutathione transferase [Komagataella phaffii GS115]